MAIDPQLDKVISSMTSCQKEAGTACKSDGDRPWLNFSDIKKVGKFDFSGVHDLFNRNSSNDEYARLKQSGSSQVKDIQTAKLSADFLAGCERDYRARTRSRIRTLVHGSVVSPVAMGESTGPLRRNTIDWLGRIMVEEVKR